MSRPLIHSMAPACYHVLTDGRVLESTYTPSRRGPIAIFPGRQTK